MAPGAVSARPSAACEIFWGLERIERNYKKIRQPRLELPGRIPAAVQRRTAEFWSDGVSGFMELLVLADWAGVLFGTDPDEVLGIVEEQAVTGGPAPAFASELPEERAQLHRRLERLASDSRTRKRYAEMIRAAWEYFRPSWSERGVTAVQDACVEWSRHLEQNELLELLPEHHVVRTMGLDALVSSAAAEGRLVFSPGFFYGNSHAFDLHSTLSVGMSLERHPLDHRFRLSGHIVAGQLAVLGNPDRATLLAAVQAGHVTEAELARVCGFSPSAVRRHLNVLRRADLVVAEGGKPMRFRVAEDAIDRLFSDSSARLLGSVREAGRRYWERLAAAAEYRAVFDGAPVGILQLDLEGNCLTCNPAAEHLFEASRRELAQLSWGRFLADAADDDALRSGSRRELRLRRIGGGDDAAFWASVSMAAVADAEGRPHFRYAMIEDLSERKHAEEALRESEHRFRTVFRRAGVGIARLSPAGRIIEANPALAQMLGLPEEELEGRLLSTYLDVEQFHPGVFERLWSDGRDEAQAEGKLRDSGGREIWVSASVSLVRDDAGAPAFVIALLEDITGRKAHEQLLTYRALHDPLTDLPNRVLFRDRLEQALRLARRGKEGLALMLLDLDGFKDVNDTHGHHVGDLVLIEVAGRLLHSVRVSDTVGRLGGDEFAVLLPDVADDVGVTRATAQILERLRVPIEVGSIVCQVGASIGVALYPANGSDVEALLGAADAAMYEAKRAQEGFRLAAARQDSTPPTSSV
jgi:diguanylate cyclase (GGDEF)-like protein/PAS domain S-box-containing protein